jgi:hypothetical protein
MAAGFLMGYPHLAEDRVSCVVQGFLLNLFSLSSLMWTFTLAYFLKKKVLDGKNLMIEDIKEGENTMASLVAINFLVPLFFSILPTATDSYGPDGLTCWFQTNSLVMTDDGKAASQVWKVAHYFCTWMVLIYAVSVMIKVRKVKSEDQNL